MSAIGTTVLKTGYGHFGDLLDLANRASIFCVFMISRVSSPHSKPERRFYNGDTVIGCHLLTTRIFHQGESLLDFVLEQVGPDLVQETMILA